MKKNVLSKIVATIGFILVANTGLWAQQQVNTLYFLDNAPMRHHINPAFQPASRFYLELPIVGYTNMWLGNSSFALSDILYTDPNGNTVTALHPQYGDRDKLFNGIDKATLVDADMKVNLLSLGWSYRKSYWHIFINERLSIRAGLPRDLVKFPLYGMSNLEGTNNFDLKATQVALQLYTEVGLGFSHQLNEKIGFGLKVKGLIGNAYASTLQNRMMLTMSPNQWGLHGSGTLSMAIPGNLIAYPETLDQLLQPDQMEMPEMELTPENVLTLLKPSGIGAAVDLGIEYQPLKMLKLSAAVVDLGSTRWSGKRYNYAIDATYDGVGTLSYDMIENGTLGDTITARLENMLNNALVDDGDSSDKFWQMISPKLNVAVEGCFLNDKIGVGLISQTGFINRHAYEELTLGLSLRPSDWFNFAASYSFINGRWSSIGAGLSVGKQGINITLAADYVPLSYAQYQGKAFVPYKSEGINIAFGLGFVVGRKKVRDTDKDGVLNKFDLCPNTPPLVPVDKNGCPIDSDGDGVADYLDQCPNTPAEAYPTVDVHGCPADSDADGVPDYLDQCPDTPREAKGKTDEKGCPKDSDLDGVPDYLDQCPDTPREAYGHVDEKGCLKDTDKDGVYDYIDRCPDTPEEAKSDIDEYGCPKDSDLDGVPDYLDQCPDTPEAARPFVNEAGCPKDTDNDSVPDYLDHCPTIAGEASNNGCPEIKREVRNLFKKALQGIQFETGKSVIKKQSYGILQEIAQVLLDNPTWSVEIQGHTDNVGKSESNLTLSNNRATAVREFLIKEGVPAERMTAKGYGDTMPVADNATSKGRAQNRRVEFVVSFEQITYETLDIQGNVIATDTIQ